MTTPRPRAALLWAFLPLALGGCQTLIGIEDLSYSDGGVSCALTSDCPPDEVCSFGICSARCRQDIDCAAGERCLSTAAGNACVSSSDGGAGSPGAGAGGRAGASGASGANLQGGSGAGGAGHGGEGAVAGTGGAAGAGMAGASAGQAGSGAGVPLFPPRRHRFGTPL